MPSLRIHRLRPWRLTRRKHIHVIVAHSLSLNMAPDSPKTAMVLPVREKMPIAPTFCLVKVF